MGVVWSSDRHICGHNYIEYRRAGIAFGDNSVLGIWFEYRRQTEICYHGRVGECTWTLLEPHIVSLGIEP
jgi:hypothetical protein